MCWIKRKTYSYLKENNDEDRKAKDTKTCILIRKLRFQDCENCLNANKTDGKIKYLEKKIFKVDNLKGFVKSKLILKIQ